MIHIVLSDDWRPVKDSPMYVKNL